MKGARLGEICSLHYGKGLRGYDGERAETRAVRVFGTNGPIGWTSSPLYEEPTIIVGRKGAYRGVHFAPSASWTIDTAYFLTLKVGQIDLKWLYYRLLLVDVNRMDTGAAIPSTKREDFYAVRIHLPDYSQQVKIAAFLSAYDDLIENNRRRIQLLEAAARLLYKEWFVHLRFPGHEHVTITGGVPEGWEKKPLGEVAPLSYGKGLKEDDRVPGPHPVYGSSGIVGWHDRPLVRGPTIIVGRKGNVGSVYWSNCDCFPIDTVYYIDSERCSLFLYYALSRIQFISTDVAVPGLNRDFAHSRRILIPDSKILILFHQHVDVIHSQLDRLTSCNKALASARDLLLPRLMNGEISV